MGRPFVAKPLPSQERLIELMTYDAITGELFWNERDASSFSCQRPEGAALRWNNLMAGKPAGGKPHKGYVRCFIDGLHHFAHRIAWKMHHGEDPLQVDHINGDKLDNSIANLRNVTQQVNSKNRKMYLTNNSGVNGVSFHKRDEVWQARVSVGQGKDVHLGNFDTKPEAVAARMAADIMLNYHENHGSMSRKEK